MGRQVSQDVAEPEQVRQLLAIEVSQGEQVVVPDLNEPERQPEQRGTSFEVEQPVQLGKLTPQVLQLPFEAMYSPAVKLQMQLALTLRM